MINGLICIKDLSFGLTIFLEMYYLNYQIHLLKFRSNIDRLRINDSNSLCFSRIDLIDNYIYCS
jgi:hypothetical protein